MTCNKRSLNSDERFFTEQEHRNISRLWKKTIEKQSKVDLNQGTPATLENLGDGGRREVHFGGQDECANYGDSENERKKLEAMQRKIAKGKTLAKMKTPLQKFDDVVTKELINRRLSQEGGMPAFEGSKKWSTLQFSGSKLSDFGVGKISIEGKVSRGALHSFEKEVRNDDPSEVPDPALMDAIERLAQAQAFCRFDAAVKAAEAATASVPPEKAEEVAVACAKDYQSEIVDVINEKISLSEDKKPVEVIGYIGVTKLKDNV